MIQEYYLHMFCGANGDHDQSTGAGRLAIATLMAGYGLHASTKKDLQTRIGWTTTPGCFLGQRELQIDDYYLRNYPETQFAARLTPFRKVNRTMNYQLDWGVLDVEWDYRVTSTVWLNLAKIYWLGFFLFGRCVLPDHVIEKLREKFIPRVIDQTNQRQNLQNPFVMQFLKNIGIPLTEVRQPHLFTNSQEDLPRFKIFASFAIAMNWTENATGFYTVAAMINSLVPVGRSLGDITEYMAPYTNSRSGRFAGNYVPLVTQHYYLFGMGRPALPNGPARMPSQGKDIIPLLYADLTRTPQQEASANYQQVRGATFNVGFLGYNLHTWMTAAMMWEYHLMLTGEPLFPLEALSAVRLEKGWNEEVITANLIYLSPANQKNSSVSQLVKFNLGRQLQV